ncbi:MAG: ATP-binding protein [Clostridia bacterium]|nr:ATP-binding protein [Clostridia bacterium]
MRMNKKGIIKAYQLIYLLIFSCIVIIFSLVGFKSGSSGLQGSISSVMGHMDLRKFDFEAKGPASLQGDWEFYWNELIEPSDFEKGLYTGKPVFLRVPGNWNSFALRDRKLPADGYATYRVIISLKSNTTYALKLPYAATAYKLWVNQQEIMSNGIVGKNKGEGNAQMLPQIASFRVQNETAEIVIWVSNYGYSRGGLPSALLLGTEKQILEKRDRQLAMDLFLFGCIFIMGVYHLALFTQRKNDNSNLFFGILCLLISVRTVLIGERFLCSLMPGLNASVYLKVSSLSNASALPFFLMFIRSLYPDEIPKKFMVFSQLMALLFSIIVVFFPEGVFSQFVIPYEVLTLGIFGCLLLYLIKAIVKKRESALIVTLGAVFGFPCITIDLLKTIGMVNRFSLIPFGVFLFIFIQSFVLAGKFSKSFTMVKVLSQKLMSLDKLKDEFLANTSHELRTPLNGMIGIAQSMLEGAKGEWDTAQKYNLSLIVSSGKRLSNLINDILDFSKLKNKDLTLQLKSIDIKQVAEMVISLLRPLAKGKELKIVNQMDPRIPLVSGDENRVQQILYNLIGNAIKFTEKGMIKVDAWNDGDFVHISVTDTGIGIPEEHFEDIFRSFEQLDGSETRKYEGTGIGLSITKYLVELHGGTIRVKSQVNRGSEFTFTLPVSDEVKYLEGQTFLETCICIDSEELPVNETGTKPAATGAVRILAVDDDPLNLRVLVQLLSLHGYSVISSTRGKDALGRILDQKEEFDMVILDIMMPEMSGYEVCQRLRNQYSLQDLPILMLTAKNQLKDTLACFEAGANDFLSKPVEKLELLARVRALLSLKTSVKQEKMLRIAEVKCLQAQIKPHFLFNALNTILYCCRSDSSKAQDLLMDLSSYLRGGFSFRSGDEFVPLETELSHVKSYLSLEKARFSDKLNIIYDIEDEIEFNIPPLILQPIVENAVRHGLLPKIQGGTVKISIKKEENDIRLTVEDDGVGIPDEKIEDLLNGVCENAGIGITNVNNRLKTIYNSGLEIKSKLDEGTQISFRIPL